MAASVLLATLLALGVSTVSLLTMPDQCKRENYKTFENSVRRSSAVPTDDNHALFCDNGIVSGWYKILPLPGSDVAGDILWIKDEDDAPPEFVCGTERPAFLYQDTDPFPVELYETTSNIPVSLPDGFGGIETRLRVKITKCDGFHVYFLDRIPERCDIAYCFSGKEPCEPGTFSASGYKPCSANVPQFNGIPSVEYHVANNKLVFTCDLSNVRPANGVNPSQYQFKWYMLKADDINGVAYQVHEVIGGANSNELLESDWTDKSTLGVDITCSVAGVDGATVGPSKTSDPFFAGLKVDQQGLDDVQIYGNGRPNAISIIPTVPVLCPETLTNQQACSSSLQITVLTRDIEQATCAKGVRNNSPNILLDDTKCGGTITPVSTDTLSGTTINVIGRRTDLYTGDGITTMIIGVAEEQKDGPFKHWFQKLPDVQVRVVNRNFDVSGKKCEFFNDPHIKTFARSRHFDIHTPGTYTLYKHAVLPIEIQGRFEKCPYNSASCNCGIAIKSGADVFVQEFCAKKLKVSTTERFNQFTRVGVLGCDNNAMDIEENNGGYTITLPTGTRVVLPKVNQATHAGVPYLYMSWMHIYPSPQDVGHSTLGGLCGVLPGLNGQDLKLKTGKITADIAEFGASWKVEVQHDLIKSPRLARVGGLRLPTQCTCNADGVAVCEANQAGTRCRVQNLAGLTRVCDSNDRTKRETGANEFDMFNDDAFEFPDEPEVEPPPAVFRNGWTEVRAQTFCTDFLTRRNSAECQAIIGDELGVKIQACVDDIRLVGDESYAIATLETTLESCLDELNHNNSMWVPLIADEEGTGNVIFRPNPTILAQICPAGCNERGSCNDGVCTCNQGYTGPACEVDFSIVPADLSLLNSVCDKTSSCESVDVFGSGFHSFQTPTCRLQMFVLQGSEKQFTTTITVTAEVLSVGQVRCNVTQQDDSDETSGYDISVSNDGRTYSEPTTLTVIDGRCYNFNRNSGVIDLQPYACILNGVCLGDYRQSIQVECFILCRTRFWQNQDDDDISDALKQLLRVVECGPGDGVITPQ